MCINGFALPAAGLSGDEMAKPQDAIRYVITAITILAVAVPEGLPLAVNLSLLLTSITLSKKNNLVKQLATCETMGSATTICTDKTGTLTANRMTVRGLSIGKLIFNPEPTDVAARVKASQEVTAQVKEEIAKCSSICSMDESGFEHNEVGLPTFKGNPTECALLVVSNHLGFDYKSIRGETEGRSEETLAVGYPRIFSSKRKLMSWAVPNGNSGYRVYAKGASEIILERVVRMMQANGDKVDMTAEMKTWLEQNVISHFASEAMRTIGLAYKDVESGFDADALSDSVLNADGSPASLCETELTLICITGIEDPLREQVPGAIQTCYKAGIDVRMVTGDNLQTAIAIARRANILDESIHYTTGNSGQKELLPLRAMEGSDFRKRVHTPGPDCEPVFDQGEFDKIWPYLRVLARSSPDDKLTLANGLNKSMLFENDQVVKDLENKDQI